jgi:hypothetical protein
MALALSLRDVDTILQGHTYVLDNATNLKQIHEIYMQATELCDALIATAPAPSPRKEKRIAAAKELIDRALSMYQIAWATHVRSQYTTRSNPPADHDSTSAFFIAVVYAAALCAFGAYCMLALGRIAQVVAGG